MPANADLYLFTEQEELKKLFQVSNDGTLDYIEVPLGENCLRFKLMPQAKVAPQLQSLLTYITSLPDAEDRKQEAVELVSKVKSVIGLVTTHEFQDDPDLWQGLFGISDMLRGFVFEFNSVVVPGTVVVGPLKLVAPAEQ